MFHPQQFLAVEISAGRFRLCELPSLVKSGLLLRDLANVDLRGRLGLRPAPIAEYSAPRLLDDHLHRPRRAERTGTVIQDARVAFGDLIVD
eukprot:3211957-Pyramimonas_sp.AAC.1